MTSGETCHSDCNALMLENVPVDMVWSESHILDFIWVAINKRCIDVPNYHFNIHVNDYTGSCTILNDYSKT